MGSFKHDIAIYNDGSSSIFLANINNRITADINSCSGSSI